MASWLLSLSWSQALTLWGGLGSLIIVLALQKRWRSLQSMARGILVSYITLSLIIGAGEVYFRYVHADSGWGFTLAHRNWESRYWQINQAGYRDREWQSSDLDGKTVMIVLGDSFASGWGVNDPADRFGDVLAAHLGERYAVVNLAKPGTSTRSQLDILRHDSPAKPDIVLLQYFLNDIEDASAGVARFWEAAFPDVPPRLIQESYLLNAIHWTLYARSQVINTTFEGSYWDWQYETYDLAPIWEAHRAEIHALIDEVEALDAQLYVVIFPNMEDPVRSVPYVDRVKFVFEDRGYADFVLPLFDEVAAWSPQEVVVSPRDAHPSAAFHRFVGDLLYERFFASDR